MEMKIKSQVQFNDDLSQRSNIVSGDSLSNSFAKIHHDLNDYEIAANIAANDKPKNLLYIHDILSDSVSTATEEILGYTIEPGTYVYSAEIYTVQNPSVANVTKIEFLGADGNTVVGTCNIACDTKKEEHINVTLSDEAYYIKYYRDTYSSETVGYLKTSKQMICLPNVYAAFPEYTMYAPSLGETFLEVEDSVKTYDVQDTYDSSSYKAISGKGVAAALDTLDVPSVGGSGKYISAISETDGKIAATPTAFDTALSSSSTNGNAPTSKAVYDDQQRQEVEIGAVANRGAKNLLEITESSKTIKGITFTVNDDGTIRASGTLTSGQSSAVFAVARNIDPSISGNSYYMSGCPEGGGGSTWRIVAELQGSPYSNVGTDNGSGVLLRTAASVYYVYAQIFSTDPVDLLFKPMIRPASIVDPTFVPYSRTNAELTVENDSQQSEINYVVNTGVKNLASINITSGAYIGFKVTTTRETVTVQSGTTAPSPTPNFRILTPSIALKAGTYEITGCPATGTDSTYRLDVRYTGSSGSNVVAAEYGAGKSFTLAQDSTVGIFMRFERGYTVTTPITFKPMLCLKSLYDSDNSYQPYAKTNVELTVAEDEDRAALIEQVDSGAKNLLRNTASSQVVGGVTFTVNADGTIIANGTKTNNGWFYLSTGNSLAAGTYVLSSGLAPQSDMSIRLLISTEKNVESAIMSAEGGRQVHIKQLTSDYTGLYYAIRISSGTTVNNVVFKPMLCTASDWTVSQKFVPYALPNPILTPAAIKAVDEGAKNKFDPASAWDSKTVYGITITRNGDTYSIASGTTQSGDNNFINMGYQANTNLIPAGDWVLSFDTPQQNVRLQVCWNGALQANASFGNNCFFTVPENTTDSWFRILLKGSTNMAGTSFKIMLCPRVFWEISHAFLPYAPTNRELYESDKVIDISNAITAGTGYTVESTTHLYYQNKQVFGTIAIAINSGSYPSSLTAIAKLPVEYAPARQYLGSCGFSTDQWAITNIGYVFIQGANASSTAQIGQISVKSPTANLTHMILNVCYPVQIDEVLAAT